jgi:hypothetical protein
MQQVGNDSLSFKEKQEQNWFLRLLPKFNNFIRTNTTIESNFLIASDLWPIIMDTEVFASLLEGLILEAHEQMREGGEIDILSENIHGSELKMNPPPKIDRFIRIIIRKETKGWATFCSPALKFSRLIWTHSGYLFDELENPLMNNITLLLPASNVIDK